MITGGWSSPLETLDTEISQREYEGFIISDEVKRLRKSLDASSPEEAFERVYCVLESAEMNPDFGYVQPYSLEAIRAVRPARECRRFAFDSSKEVLIDKFKGAWTFRAAGCALGKPVESWSRIAIKDMLLERGEWPLDDYFSLKPRSDAKAPLPWCHLSCRENISFMEPDDDIHYTLIALHVLEKHGFSFRWFDIANAWNSCLPYNAVCTAETQAILNYNMRVPRCGAWRADEFTTPEFTSGNSNPYREWIGAQIRADGFGYACPGNPELASELAWRDASWTHRANGIYGEMFIAAVTAAAFSGSSFDFLISAGLGEIPQRSRLAGDILWTCSAVKRNPDWEGFMDEFDVRFKGMSGVHTNNNCSIVVMALYYGGGDPEKTISIAVSAGLDTDCNGATAGSIAGICRGFAASPKRLASKLNDTIEPNVFGFSRVSMSSLAERQYSLLEKNDK